MNSELNQVRNPFRIYIFWSLLYVLIIVFVVASTYIIAGKIKTHTLPVGSIELDVPYSKYLVGETVTFSIKNKYNNNVYVMNNCPTEPLDVYRLEEGTWVRIHDYAPLKDCGDDPRIIDVPANGVVNGSFEKWKNLFSKPGKYRIVAYVEYYNELPYKDIEIINKPKPYVAPIKQSTNQQQTQSRSPAQTQNDNESEDEDEDSFQEYSTKKSKTVSISSGTVKVQYDQYNVYVVSIAPANGCTYEGGKSGREVEVTFKCAGGETQLQMWVSNGQLVSKIEDDD